ncbi:MAG TPA: DedA family protein [Pseudorhodoplanes sp.]|jgi:membrane protein DedA with SNARE-associated domain|nr:DedA family protein [Pseudorhodoplanes sp.]
MFDQYVQLIVDFVRSHHAWAAPIIFVLAFLESIAFFSLLIPAWSVLILIGGLVAASGIPFVPVLVGGAIGAALGDWVSYAIGYRFKEPIAHVWPLSRHPELLPRGHAFMEKWGVLGIFIGRFFGPLRASVPLIAGIVEMPYLTFQIANFASAFVWAYVLLSFGHIGAGIFKWLG